MLKIDSFLNMGIKLEESTSLEVVGRYYELGIREYANCDGEDVLDFFYGTNAYSSNIYDYAKAYTLIKVVEAAKELFQLIVAQSYNNGISWANPVNTYSFSSADANDMNKLFELITNKTKIVETSDIEIFKNVTRILKSGRKVDIAIEPRKVNCTLMLFLESLKKGRIRFTGNQFK